MKSKIEWTDYTWNPVWGCNAGCEYCYAKNLARRFAKPISEKETSEKINQLNIESRLSDFKPTFLWSNFRNFKFPNKPSKIFIGSMSDISFWEDEWIGLTTHIIKQFPQHTYLLLTKFPKVYEWLDKIMPENVAFGVTVTKTSELEKMITLLRVVENPIKRKFFTSFEPLLEYIPTKTLFGSGLTDWVIVGSMSGVKNKQRTKTEWIGAIVEQAKKYNMPVFVKQLEINGKIETDISKFPAALQIRQFPDFSG